MPAGPLAGVVHFGGVDAEKANKQPAAIVVADVEDKCVAIGDALHNERAFVVESVVRIAVGTRSLHGKVAADQSHQSVAGVPAVAAGVADDDGHGGTSSVMAGATVSTQAGQASGFRPDHCIGLAHRGQRPVLGC